MNATKPPAASSAPAAKPPAASPAPAAKPPAASPAPAAKPPALTPYPLRVLLGRIAHEWETRHRIFDLPTGRFFHQDPVRDLGVAVAGRTAATPVGPAAGPHTQLAQNYVLGWLAGARTFEMKTVQVLDELDIPRPCIDAEAEGYNVEWSQELRIDQSVEEYAKAWILLEILSRWEPLRPLLGLPGPHVFDLSVGYDLAGITSDRMARFVHDMKNAGPIIDALRPEIPEPFAEFRDYPFPDQLASSVTLSTFHGCPPFEIDAISRYLMEDQGLDVTVKLNPTLLGHDAARALLDRLGFGDVLLDPAAFEADLAFAAAVELIDSLARFAAQHGRTFGIKLTNTLVVGNHRSVLPGDVMYLSGPPLHVITTTLLDRLVEALPGRLRLGTAAEGVGVSFSGGIGRDNLPQAVGLGLAPVTVCTDLLKPGGYGRFSGMLKHLAAEMEDAGCGDVAAWRAHAEHDAQEAGHRDAVAAYAARLNRAGPDSPFGATGAAKRLRHVDSDLELWDCVSCNLCVTVCPNDAMLHLPTPEGAGLGQRWQYLCLAELCNDCGNCTTFCPERGDPFRAKPRLFLDAERWSEDTGPAFLVRAADGGFEVTGAVTVAGEAPRLAAVLAGPEGLPLRPGDLPGQA